MSHLSWRTHGGRRVHNSRHQLCSFFFPRPAQQLIVSTTTTTSGESTRRCERARSPLESAANTAAKPLAAERASASATSSSCSTIGNHFSNCISQAKRGLPRLPLTATQTGNAQSERKKERLGMKWRKREGQNEERVGKITTKRAHTVLKL